MSTATVAPPRKPAQQQKKALSPWDCPTDKGGLERLVGDAVVKNFSQALPPFMKKQAERMIRCMITECQQNPALLECTPANLFGQTLRAAQLGLTIGAPAGEAYLIPFKQRANLVIGYKGALALAHRSKEVRRITPVVVREGDTFDYRRGYDQTLMHAPLRGNNRKATDFYVVVELLNGGMDFETFTFDDAIEHRNRYALAKSGPWYDMVKGGFEEMAKKTLILRLAKRLPRCVELCEAAHSDGTEAPDFRVAVPDAVTTVPAADPLLANDIEAAELREQLEAAGGEPVPGGNGRLFGDSGQLPD